MYVGSHLNTSCFFASELLASQAPVVYSTEPWAMARTRGDNIIIYLRTLNGRVLKTVHVKAPTPARVFAATPAR